MICDRCLDDHADTHINGMLLCDNCASEFCPCDECLKLTHIDNLIEIWDNRENGFGYTGLRKQICGICLSGGAV